MRLLFARWTVFQAMLAVVVMAIALKFACVSKHQHAELCLQLANFHARTGAEYRKNAGSDPVMLRTAAWHDFMRRRFEQAADRPWEPIPAFDVFPPMGWQPPRALAIGK
jgi:hypothetical protein